MNRKDYLNLAAALKSTKPVRNAIPQWVQWNETVHAVADAIADSTRTGRGETEPGKGFNRHMFLQNCGVTT